MRFLRRFWTALRGYLSREEVASHRADGRSSLAPDSELNDRDDVLARFLLQKNHFKRAENRATPDAFMPPPDLQLSVYQITNVPEDKVWALGRAVLKEHPQPRLYGRADVRVGAVHEQKLKALQDDDPPRHVNVVGWPSYADGKDLLKSIAQQLAQSAKLDLLVTPLSK